MAEPRLHSTFHPGDLLLYVGPGSSGGSIDIRVFLGWSDEHADTSHPFVGYSIRTDGTGLSGMKRLSSDAGHYRSLCRLEDADG